MTTRTSFPSPITLATLPELFAHNRALYGGFVMEDPPADPPPAADPPKSDPPPADPPAGDPPAGDKTFTQAELDKIIGDRLAKERETHAAKIKEIEESAGKTELEKLTAERDKYKAESEGGKKTAGAELAKLRAEILIPSAGGKSDFAAKIVKQADLSDAVNDDGTVDEDKVKSAVEKVLAEFPEWKGTPGSSGGELGNGGGDGGKKRYTRKQLSEMSPKELAEQADDIAEAYAAGRVTS